MGRYRTNEQGPLSIRQQDSTYHRKAHDLHALPLAGLVRPRTNETGGIYAR
jgi:hypothetical protein